MPKDIKAMNNANLKAYKDADVENNFASVPGWGDNSYNQKRLFQKIGSNPKRVEGDLNNNDRGNIFSTTNGGGVINNKVHYGMNYFLGDNEQLFYQEGNGRNQRNNFRVNTFSKSTDFGNSNSVQRRISNSNQKIKLQNAAQTS